MTTTTNIGTPKATIEPSTDNLYRVRAIWTDAPVDRQQGYACDGLTRPVAERLARAIEAGAILVDPVIKTDINGKTYVSSTWMVRGRAMNADLKRLGF